MRKGNRKRDSPSLRHMPCRKIPIRRFSRRAHPGTGSIRSGSGGTGCGIALFRSKESPAQSPRPCPALGGVISNRLAIRYNTLQLFPAENSFCVAGRPYNPRGREKATPCSAAFSWALPTSARQTSQQEIPFPCTLLKRGTRFSVFLFLSAFLILRYSQTGKRPYLLCAIKDISQMYKRIFGQYAFAVTGSIPNRKIWKACRARIPQILQRLLIRWQCCQELTAMWHLVFST